MHMKKQPYISTVAVVFLVVAILHALRLIYGWEGVIGGWEVPFSLSWVVVVFTAYLSWQGFRHRK